MDFQFTRLRIAMMKSAITRTKYLVDHKIFASVGENFYFQPRIIPINPEYIKFGNNVAVATNVQFVCHDIIQMVFNNIAGEKVFKKKYGCIEVKDNVFIGANSIIMYNVSIGSNVIVAAGSVVTKDVPSGTIVAGVPAKVIGSFDELYAKRLKESAELEADSYTPEVCWKIFDELHNKE